MPGWQSGGVHADGGVQLRVEWKDWIARAAPLPICVLEHASLLDHVAGIQVHLDARMVTGGDRRRHCRSTSIIPLSPLSPTATPTETDSRPKRGVLTINLWFFSPPLPFFFLWQSCRAGNLIYYRRQHARPSPACSSRSFYVLRSIGFNFFLRASNLLFLAPARSIDRRIRVSTDTCTCD